MLNFLDINFPSEIACGSSGGPQYCTTINVSSSGIETRNINWSQPRMRFNVGVGIKNNEQMKKLIGFFHMCRGRANGFRFKDWRDYKADNVLLGVGNGERREFQLRKVYSLDELSISPSYYSQIKEKIVTGEKEKDARVVREGMVSNKYKDKECVDVVGESRGVERLCRHIHKPVLNSVIVSIDGEVVNNKGSNVFIVDYSVGTVTFAEPPAIGAQIKASFEFDLPVRFDIDYLPTISEGLGIHRCSEIPIVEIKMPIHHT